MSQKTIGFIGAGNMAGAILNGIISKGYIKPDNIYIYDVDLKKCEKWSKYGVSITSSECDLVNKSDYVFLCVKPQVAPSVLKTISVSATKEKCFISIMAGLSIETISQELSGHKNIIRIMPNTPLMVGYGATALVKTQHVPEDDFELIRNVFELSGETVVVSQKMLDSVVALSGSGPAYFFKFANAAIEEAVELGLDYDMAVTLLSQTMIGSAKMLLESKYTPNELVAMVTSPNGTTYEANKVFESEGYEEIIKKAMKACYDRSVELGKV